MKLEEYNIYQILHKAKEVFMVNGHRYVIN